MFYGWFHIICRGGERECNCYNFSRLAWRDQKAIAESVRECCYFVPDNMYWRIFYTDNNFQPQALSELQSVSRGAGMKSFRVFSSLLVLNELSLINVSFPFTARWRDLYSLGRVLESFKGNLAIITSQADMARNCSSHFLLKISISLLFHSIEHRLLRTETKGVGIFLLSFFMDNLFESLISHFFMYTALWDWFEVIWETDDSEVKFR